MFRKIMHYVLEMLITIVIVAGLCALIAYLISSYKHYVFKETLSWVGLITAILGGLSLLKGNPTGANMGSNGVDLTGSGSQTYNNYLNMEVTRMERDITKYWGSTKNHGLMQIKSRRLFTLLGGIAVYAVSIFI